MMPMKHNINLKWNNKNNSTNSHNKNESEQNMYIWIFYHDMDGHKRD
jgi:hypothetical protein